MSKKLLLVMAIALLRALGVNSQTTVYEAKKIKALDSVYINGNWVKSVMTDSALSGGTVRDLPSTDAVKKYINNRIAKYVPLAGGTMTGNLVFAPGNYGIVNPRFIVMSGDGSNTLGFGSYMGLVSSDGRQGVYGQLDINNNWSWYGRTDDINSGIVATIYRDGTLFSNTLAASRLLLSDASKNIVSSSVTSTEAGYLSGVTSPIQTQLNGKGDISGSGTSGQLAVMTGTKTISSYSGLNWNNGTSTLGITGTYNSSTLTASKALVSDGSKNIISSSVSATELGYLGGVTSSLQTQIDAKGTGDITGSGTSGQLAVMTGTKTISSYSGLNWNNGTSTLGITGTYNSSTLTASKALVSDGSKNIISSSVSATELGYLSGVTSPIQAQINALGSGNISGSGSSGQVAYMTGTNSIGSSGNFLWNNATATLSVTGLVSNYTATSTIGSNLTTAQNAIAYGVSGTEVAQMQVAATGSSFVYSSTGNYTPHAMTKTAASAASYYKQNGNLNGIASVYSSAGEFSGVGNTTEFANYRAIAPAQQSGFLALSGTIATYDGFLVDDIRGSAIASKIGHAYSINLKGANDTANVAGTVLANKISVTDQRVTGNLTVGDANIGVIYSYTVSIGTLVNGGTYDYTFPNTNFAFNTVWEVSVSGSGYSGGTRFPICGFGSYLFSFDGSSGSGQATSLGVSNMTFTSVGTRVLRITNTSGLTSNADIVLKVRLVNRN